MSTVLVALDLLTAVLRTALFAVVVVAAAGAGLAWGVRTRRLNPFGAAGRLARGTVDPLLRPVERRVVAAGGRPANAPWWALAALVVGGLALLSLLGFLRGQLGQAAVLAGAGPRGLLLLLVRWTLAVLQVALLARVISSWFRLTPWSRWVRWAYVLTDWFMRPLQRVIPPLGMVDVSPLVAYLLLSWVLEPVVTRLVAGG